MSKLPLKYLQSAHCSEIHNLLTVCLELSYYTHFVWNVLSLSKKERTCYTLFVYGRAPLAVR